jgi:hypothetical protein
VWGAFDFMPMSDDFTLIKAAPTDPAGVCAVVENLATKLRRRDRCHWVEALPPACDENLERFIEYCRAFGTVL